MIQIQDPAVQAALITGIAGVFAAAIAGISAVLVGKRFVDKDRLAEKLDLAVADVAFLLAVEKMHLTERAPEKSGTLKQRVRQDARKQGLTWSGRFTPGRAQAQRRRNYL